MNRRYDRNIPAPLPKKRMLSRVNAVPDVVDLRPWAGPVKDQGAEGACTAHAGSSAMEWIARRYSKTSPIFSPQYLYARELIRQGNFPQDQGSDGNTLCETMIQFGCCELSDYPYVAGQIVAPTPEQDANAAKHKLGAYHGLDNSATFLSVLGDPTPWPVEIGFTVYDSFESADTARTGIMKMPGDNESILGGHEVLALGYDIGAQPTIRPAGCPPAALIQNSWGTGWGVSGFFWMPLDVLNEPDTDLKIAHSGHAW